ncbi:molybdenum cofactor biosynthesis protein MoaA [Burkholderia stagnalis]|nr:molybdenum cofactor biosynthesis protein MoaA [Burkholderia stagnalis]RQQ23807.1 molybdenum cofactor biosynthesis protein MoaA [Burkholderia stagnalis]RQQ52033.1 molybdenum cofactor biosynthesis protein MoaA [Burkholderia stagnalis]RQX99220.1 molybdenum cofactor biosynthesis protein MoaA [Burkholderia stagnalis]RQY05739.1 molybdenum cofactor biosynthesis protein MoaA [Burkholderia stagnalis]
MTMTNDLLPMPAWLADAYRRCADAVPGGMRVETVPVEHACGRVLAQAVTAPDALPRLALAAIEGYALRAGDAAHASPARPATLNVRLQYPVLIHRGGDPAARALSAGDAEWLPALAPLPAHADTVVPRSRNRAPDGQQHARLDLDAPPVEGEGVIARGADYACDALLLDKGQRIGAEQQALLIAAGVRTVEVSRRPRVCVVVASYDLVPPAGERQPWQRPDANGPYLCALLKQWGYDASLEYVAPPDMTLPPLESRDAELAFRRQLAELAQRYDLLVGTGVLAEAPHQEAALNRLPVFPVSEARVTLPQVHGARFNFGRSEDRSPAQRRTFELTDAAGRPRGSRVVTYFDQATLVNLPGYPGDVAILAHTILRRLIDLLEFVDVPGPYWETGVLGAPTSRDPMLNDLRWATLAAGATGEPVVTPLAGERADAFGALAGADALVAIESGATPLAAGSPVLFMRLDQSRRPVRAARAAVEDTQAVRSSAVDASHTAASDATRADATGAAAPSPHDTIAAAWSRLDAWRRTLPADAPEPFRGPASDEDLRALEAGLGVALPEAWRESLRLHDGQEAGRTEPFAGETLLSARQILAQWSIWHELVARGDLADCEGEPEPGIRGDWYNLKWIPLTHNGSGDHLCIDLDPDEGGRIGQVIRVWHDSPEREHVAESVGEWLARVVPG